MLFGTPLPSLLPYVLLTGAAASQIMQRRCEILIRVGVFSGSDGLVLTYVLLYGLHMVFHVAVAEIVNIKGLLADAVNFLLPVGFYLYFRCFGLGGLRYLMSGVLVASLVISVLTAFHSYKKIDIYGESMVLYLAKKIEPQEVPAKDDLHQCGVKQNGTLDLYGLLERYQWNASYYSAKRSSQDESFLCHSIRFSNVRSGGLLENHAVSSAFIGIGMLAALVVISPAFGLIRFALVLFFGGIAFIFQYYTGIFAFGLVALMIFIRYLHATGFTLRRLRREIILLGVALLIVSILMLKTKMALGLYLLMRERLESLMHYTQTVFFGKFHDWVAWVHHFPAGFFVGDGYGIYFPYSFNKGGDIGLFESLAKLGFPLFSFVLFMGVFWLRRCWPMVKNFADSNEVNSRFYFFCIALLIVINEIHYSVWSSKAILPIFFATIAALDRLSKNRSVDERVIG